MAKISTEERARRRDERIMEWCRSVVRLLVDCTPIGRKNACQDEIRVALSGFNMGLAANPTTDTAAYKRRFLAALEPVRELYVPGDVTLSALVKRQRQMDRAFMQAITQPTPQQMLGQALEQLRAATGHDEEDLNHDHFTR